jgi:L-2-hydroxyglutarate oxidase LhgO
MSENVKIYDKDNPAILERRVPFTSDYLIIGGGIMGLTLARTLIKKIPELKWSFLKKELIALGANFFFNEGYHSRLDGNRIRSSGENIFQSRKIINAAGLYAG